MPCNSSSACASTKNKDLNKQKKILKKHKTSTKQQQIKHHMNLHKNPNSTIKHIFQPKKNVKSLNCENQGVVKHIPSESIE